jgi:hypothetical protein
MVRYKFCQSIIEKLGFSSFGFWEETAQTSIQVSKYGFNLEKIKTGFKILRKHLKPMTVESHQSTETGIRFSVNGLSEDTSVLYVHKKGDAVLYETRYSTPKTFLSFNEFADWYSTARKED